MKSTGVNLKIKGTQFDGFTDVSRALQARDYKGFDNWSQIGVVEFEK